MICGGFFVVSAVSGDERQRLGFVQDVQPILIKHCLECHGGVKKKGGVSFASRDLAFREAESGKHPVVPGDVEKSELVSRITTRDEDDRMPPKEALTPKEISLLKTWVAEGADWPRHWSLEPVGNPKPPAVKNEKWPSSPIDRFILARLERAGISPAPEADKQTLIRRLSLDITGLLPTPKEVDDFVKDNSPDAYQRVVDRLLASPHFGERWGRHWLDEARYADSAGYEKDSTRADAYRWRDWVIHAINDDMPFDQFTIKQIAGDLLPNASREDRLATAFQLMTQFNLEGGVDAEEDRTKRVIDRVDTLGAVWLGTTIGCTQCHDHPYDPFTQKDFYHFYAFFNNSDWTGIFIHDFPRDAEKRIEERYEKWKEIKDVLDRQVTDKNLATQLQGLLSRFRSQDNSWGFTRVVVEREEKRRKTYLFHRGNFLAPEKDLGVMLPGTPGIWPPLKPRPRFAPQTSEQKKKKEKPKQLPPDRLDLAHWLVDPMNPMTARVTVNKVWQHLFGNGICPQPQDFGSKGGLPSHPELLDWLAHYFVHDAKWSRKQMIREIVNSETYRQSSDYRDDTTKLDPGNVLLARQNRFRVEAEIIRDIYLQVSGLLSPKVGGPSVFPPIPEDVAKLSYANNFSWKTSRGEDRYRRGMYTFFKRTAPDPNLVMFDCPDAAVSNQKRSSSNTPLQALATLQNEVFMGAARAMAGELLSGKLSSDQARVEWAFARCFGREPEKEERDTILKLLEESRDWYRRNPEMAVKLVGDLPTKGGPRDDLAAWIATARIILNTDEFITRS